MCRIQIRLLDKKVKGRRKSEAASFIAFESKRALKMDLYSFRRIQTFGYLE